MILGRASADSLVRIMEKNETQTNPNPKDAAMNISIHSLLSPKMECRFDVAGDRVVLNKINRQTFTRTLHPMSVEAARRIYKNMLQSGFIPKASVAGGKTQPLSQKETQDMTTSTTKAAKTKSARTSKKAQKAAAAKVEVVEVLSAKEKAQRLYRAAEKNGITPRGAAKFTDVLEDVGLTEADITEDIIRAADHIERQESARIRERVAAHNDRVKSRAQDRPAAPQTEAATQDEESPVKKSKASKSAQKAQKAEAVQEVAETKAAKKSGKKAGAKKPAAKTEGPAKIFGHSVCAVLRWMGKNGWKAEAAHTAVVELSGKDIAMATVNIQLKAGANEERGEPAPISKAQAKELKAAAK